MAPNREVLVSSYNLNIMPPRLSMESLQRTVSDLSLESSKEAIDVKLPPISEVEDAKCECCGMREECTPEYIQRVRDNFSGKWICGLCAKAVKRPPQLRWP
ncbi:hypothetical protein HHK36_021670 [Tetracentron sinense]|uniref:Uncharacterized protein n=1 Tax=Tetracentron sinense TaxID=13715 RepID=A0A834YXG1_TETSI|nr:hypothetical protein HHK36_021670 [Tetracentron sinense]